MSHTPEYKPFQTDGSEEATSGHGYEQRTSSGNAIKLIIWWNDNHAFLSSQKCFLLHM